MEDASKESKEKVREHLQKIVNKIFNNLSNVDNPWFEEFWRHKSGCLDNQILGRDCGIAKVDRSFLIDTKV